MKTRNPMLMLTMMLAVMTVFALWAPDVEAQATRHVCKVQAGPGICDEGPPYFWSEDPCIQCDVSFCESAHIYDSWYKVQYDQCEASYKQCVKQCCVGDICWQGSPSCECSKIRNACITAVAKDHKRDCDGALSMRNICKSNNNC